MTLISNLLKGTNLVIANALSRAGLGPEHDFRPRIMNMSAHTDIPDIRLEEIRETT